MGTLEGWEVSTGTQTEQCLQAEQGMEKLGFGTVANLRLLRNTKHIAKRSVDLNGATMAPILLQEATITSLLSTP